MKNIGYVNIKFEDGNVVSEVETDYNSIEFKDGYFIINGKLHSVMIMAEEFNIPIKYVKDYGDGFPRIICSYDGKEHDWWLYDAVFIELKSNNSLENKIYMDEIQNTFK
jgi:hypothetical protein